MRVPHGRYKPARAFPRLAGCRRVVGIDPSGGRSPWGIAVLERYGAWWRPVLAETASPSRAPLLSAKLALGACVACIDAPITIDPYRHSAPFRPHEAASRRMGFSLMPLTLPGMRKLLHSGIVTASLLHEAGILPCETHPSSVARLIGAPARTKGSPHAWHALIAAATGASLVEGRVVAVCSRSGCIVYPTSSAAPIFKGLQAWAEKW